MKESDLKLYKWVLTTLAEAYGTLASAITRDKHFRPFRDSVWDGRKESVIAKDKTLIMFDPAARALTFKCISTKVAKMIAARIRSGRKGQTIVAVAPEFESAADGEALVPKHGGGLKHVIA